MTLYLTCQPKDVPASEAPCSDLGGVHYGLVVVEDGMGEIDANQFVELMSWSLSGILIVYFVGFAIGSILGLIKSA